MFGTLFANAGLRRRIREIVHPFTKSARAYRAARKAFFAGFVRRGDLVFDVGANRGDMTRLFRGTGARVVAVEPQPSCRERMEGEFRGDPQVTIVAAALGASPGQGKLYPARDLDAISSMSPGWIARVKSSGRFSHYEWGEPFDVPITTLDALIAHHGTPRFVKIDVEGYEAEVVRGLSVAVHAVSIEYNAETLDTARAAAERLRALATAAGSTYRFNHCRGHAAAFDHEWSDLETVFERIQRQAQTDPDAWGDVYARLADER
jgi:FkbM family methyltransferase